MKNIFFSKTLFLALVSITLIFNACKKDEGTTTTIDPNKKGQLVIHFDNRVGDEELVLNTQTYTNSFNQQFNISKFKYFISNIELKNADGTTFTVAKDSSYFLVDEAYLETGELTLSNVPEGDYSGVTFTIGVDSLKSTAPASERTGTLDPAGTAEGMYWTWNSGYIFMKLEGTSPVAPYDSMMGSSGIIYHIGGFGGYTAPATNNIRTKTLDFGTAKAEVRNKKTVAPEVHLYVDALKVLNGTTNIDFTVNSNIMFGPVSTSIANNYVDMFSINHIHND